MAFVTEPVSPVVTTVPVTSGNVIVLSAVGSVTVNVVSKSLAVAPSNTSVKLPATAPETVAALIVGAVNVLFVSVSLPVKETKLSPCKAVLNSAKEPVKVFEPKSIVLLDRVAVSSCNTTVPVALGNDIVLSAVGSTTVNVVSLVSSVAPSNTMTASSNMFNAVPTLPLLIVGEVSVLFVSVCEPVSVATVESMSS